MPPDETVMEKEIAKNLMIELERLGNVMNDVASIIEKIDDEKEKRKFRKGIGGLMGKLYTDIMYHIIHENPDLDPDRNTEWFKELQKKRKFKNVIQIKSKEGT